MKLWQVIVLAVLVLAAVAGIGYSYRATYAAGDGNGYNRRIGEESKAFADADTAGRKAQSAADQDTIAQLQGQVDANRDADAVNRKQQQQLQQQNLDLKRRLDDAAQQNADARRWLDELIPAAVLCRLQQAPACAGTPATGAGH